MKKYVSKFKEEELKESKFEDALRIEIETRGIYSPIGWLMDYADRREIENRNEGDIEDAKIWAKNSKILRNALSKIIQLK
jgi:hypothetical protein